MQHNQKYTMDRHHEQIWTMDKQTQWIDIDTIDKMDRQRYHNQMYIMGR